MALRIKVVRKDGSDLGYGGAALRKSSASSFRASSSALATWMVAFDERKQGLHDKIANSYVIKL
ncbi:MAG: RDD family protein [Syntrophotaleaceae bacterium]